MVSQGLACIKDLKRDMKDLVKSFDNEKKTNIDNINKNYFLNVRNNYLNIRRKKNN
jgi:hypothetical protein